MMLCLFPVTDDATPPIELRFPDLGYSSPKSYVRLFFNSRTCPRSSVHSLWHVTITCFAPRLVIKGLHVISFTSQVETEIERLIALSCHTDCLKHISVWNGLYVCLSTSHEASVNTTDMLWHLELLLIDGSRPELLLQSFHALESALEELPRSGSKSIQETLAHMQTDYCFEKKEKSEPSCQNHLYVHGLFGILKLDPDEKFDKVYICSTLESDWHVEIMGTAHRI